MFECHQQKGQPKVRTNSENILYNTLICVVFYRALFPDAKCGDSMVCIIDDREDVWNMASNLIQVKPYHFFQHTGDINAPPGLAKHELDGKGVDFKEIVKKKKKEVKTENVSEGADEVKVEEEVKVDPETEKETTKDDEKPEETPAKEEKEPSETSQSSTETEKSEQNCNETKTEDSPKTSDESAVATKKKPVEPDDNLIEVEDGDDYLLYLEDILKKIHQRFYETYDKEKEIPDLKLLIPQVKAEVLIGVTIVFSGLVPNHIRLQQSKSYQIAKSLGAQVKETLDESTTHLVAATTGTNKVNLARKDNKIKVVTPEWLWVCAERWIHVDERLYPLSANKSSRMRQPPSHCQSPQHNSGDDPQDNQPKFVDTLNPLLSLSNDDIDAMNEEFEEFFESDSSSDNEPPSRDYENPPMQKSLRKRKMQEENKDNQKIFLKTDADDQVQISLKNPGNLQQQDESSSSSNSDNEMPSTKFRRGEFLNCGL